MVPSITSITCTPKRVRLAKCSRPPPRHSGCLSHSAAPLVSSHLPSPQTTQTTQTIEKARRDPCISHFRARALQKKKRRRKLRPLSLTASRGIIAQFQKLTHTGRNRGNSKWFVGKHIFQTTRRVNKIFLVQTEKQKGNKLPSHKVEGWESIGVLRSTIYGVRKLFWWVATAAPTRRLIFAAKTVAVRQALPAQKPDHVWEASEFFG